MRPMVRWHYQSSCPDLSFIFSLRPPWRCSHPIEIVCMPLKITSCWSPYIFLRRYLFLELLLGQTAWKLVWAPCYYCYRHPHAHWFYQFGRPPVTSVLILILLRCHSCPAKLVAVQWNLAFCGMLYTSTSMQYQSRKIWLGQIARKLITGATDLAALPWRLHCFWDCSDVTAALPNR